MKKLNKWGLELSLEEMDVDGVKYLGTYINNKEYDKLVDYIPKFELEIEDNSVEYRLFMVGYSNKEKKIYLIFAPKDFNKDSLKKFENILQGKEVK